MTAVTPDPETLEQAVEAAASAYRVSVGGATVTAYESLSDDAKDIYRGAVRPMLVAAYPLIAAHHEAKALREAADAMNLRFGGMGLVSDWLRDRADSIGGDQERESIVCLDLDCPREHVGGAGGTPCHLPPDGVVVPGHFDHGVPSDVEPDS